MSLLQQLQCLVSPPQAVQHTSEVVAHELGVHVMGPEGHRLAPDHKRLGVDNVWGF